MNIPAIKAIYMFEMARTRRTLFQSIVSPVISTSLYFVVFGAAIGSRITEIDGVSYGAFIVPGLIMLSLLMQSITNKSVSHPKNFFPNIIAYCRRGGKMSYGMMEVYIYIHVQMFYTRDCSCTCIYLLGK